jgi:homogentisate phytyltransferase/homogentisate geranylgeranyltransferase
MIKTIGILWRFSRPHTIVGSFISVTALYSIALRINYEAFHWQTWLITLISCLGCNLYITGLNQWADVEIDSINKPKLPIVSGELSRQVALRICLISLGISLVLAVLSGWFFTVLIVLISLIGTAYSLPPLRFKKHHLGAAAAIGLVRGVMVNTGIYLHFHWSMTGAYEFPDSMVALTVFITAFSIGIAWFKDIPDTAGDDRFQIRTLAVLLNRKRAFLLGAMLVIGAYGYMLWDAWQAGNMASLVAHGIFLSIFTGMCMAVDTGNQRSVRWFYMGFWLLFFSEYMVYPFIV